MSCFCITLSSMFAIISYYTNGTVIACVRFCSIALINRCKPVQSSKTLLNFVVMTNFVINGDIISEQSHRNLLSNPGMSLLLLSPNVDNILSIAPFGTSVILKLDIHLEPLQ